MRIAFWLFVLALSGTALAQWRHFGEGAPASTAAGDTLLVRPSISLPRDMISAHNAVRRRVGTAPLQWSEPLKAVAQEWADRLMRNGQFVHSHNPKYGENLFEITGAAASPAEVVNAWAGEARDYDYRTNGCRGVCGHYTQVVWNDTKEVGCAVARGSNREVWVCEYAPPGNWVGRKPY